MSKKLANEVPLYEWMPGFRFTRLIYSGRNPDPKADPGVRLTHSNGRKLLRFLYTTGRLTGQALADAKRLFPDEKVVFHRPESTR